MQLIMDMGTTNTRLWLCQGEEVVAEVRGPFGAKFGKTEGREALFARVGALISGLLEDARIAEADVDCVMVSGMAGSEMGLCEIPHIALPADAHRLAEAITVKHLTEITSIPFVFVPGLKQEKQGMLDDMMRGEETETVGILQALDVNEPVTIVLPGTHNKLIRVNKDGEITSFCTTFSGEMLDGIVQNSILAGQVSHDFCLDVTALLQGEHYARTYGLNAAVFHVRVLAKNGADTNVLSSFLYGAVLGGDVELIRRMANGEQIYIGGRERLREIYAVLLREEQAVPLPGPCAEGAVRRGLLHLYRLYHTRCQRAQVLEAVEKERLIAIIRNPDQRSLKPAMEAIWQGGVRMAEITFDRSGKVSKEEVARTIAYLVQEFEGRMYVGAGTVTSKREVLLAYEAGASFIISPNCDPEIIALTRRIGMVSIPSAFTPTEIAKALDSGADFVKLFPADQVSKGYVKAVKAPLSDAKLLAVGGVTAENTAELIANGFCGVGVGSNLYDKVLIERGDFDALQALARQFVTAAKQ